MGEGGGGGGGGGSVRTGVLQHVFEDLQQLDNRRSEDGKSIHFWKGLFTGNSKSLKAKS